MQEDGQRDVEDEEEENWAVVEMRDDGDNAGIKI